MKHLLLAVLLAAFAFGAVFFVVLENADAGRKVRTVHISGPYGDTFQPDSDRRVPVFISREPAVSETRFSYYGRQSEARILIRPSVLHGSRCTERRVMRHEKSHAAGWGHYEGNPRVNKAYNPTVKAC